MYQVRQSIWNEIAKTQELASPLWRQCFSASPAELSGLMERLQLRLEAKGADARVIRAYLTVAPLLDENLAISRHVQETGQISLRSSMPEVQTVNEATIMASMEFPLKPSQQARLQELLRARLADTPL